MSEQIPSTHDVHAIARKWRVDPEELYQDVCVLVLKSDGPDDLAKFDNWVNVIARRHAIDLAYRRVKSRETAVDFLETASVTYETPADCAHERERAELVVAAVRSLRPMDFDVLNAFYHDGKSVKEIAAERDIPVGTVQRRLHVARRRVAPVLQLVWSDD